MDWLRCRPSWSMDEPQMNYLSVCSGIEAATVAWHHMGWKPVGFSEIEKFPSQVLAHHYSQVTNFGDMTKYKEWNINDSAGLLVGGTPCQSFSVAGLRKGLDDPRGNLALTYVGILDKFRPKWCIWENVPGVLSSGNGRDFGAFLGALGELGYGWAYRVLDAQNFGVAQRRRRVFVVGCLGNWESAAKILFESESLQGDIKQSRKEKQEIAGNFIPSVANCLQTTSNDYSRADGTFNATPTNVATTLQKTQPSVQSHHTQTFAVSYGFNTNARPAEMNFLNEQSNTLTTSQRSGCYNNMAVRRLTPIECERLQGFPDDYTNIKENCPDGNRYRALGNSMAVPVMRWIGERINNYERI